ncbi:MAG: hypothetical protein ABL949_07490 [Fimbriimonadaceae bacterium]
MKSPEPELRVLVTHAQATPKQLALLEAPSENLAKLAAELEFDIRQDGQTLEITASNLYDLKMFEPVIRAQQVLSELAKRKKYQFTLKDLSSEDKKAMQRLLIQGVGAIGPEILDDDTPLQIGFRCSLLVKGNGKEVRLSSGKRLLSDDVDRSKLKEYSEEDRKHFREEIAPKLRPKLDVSQLLFRFNTIQTPSKRRTDLIASVAQRFSKLLDKQQEAYIKAVNALKDSLREHIKVNAGGKLQGLDDDLISGIRASAGHYKETFGFASDQEWESFLADGLVSSFSFSPTIAIVTRNTTYIPLTSVGRGG